VDVIDATVLDRFWPKVDLEGPGGCWDWTASTDRVGYGFFWDADDKRMMSAHRASFVIAGGTIPDGMVLRHTCDRPICVNPDHLVIGTQRDNIRDCIERGRRASKVGAANGRAKLTAGDIERIRSLDLSRYGAKSAAARRYGISSGQMSKILLGHSWT
jgi:hypothetical protein